jgi:hypothetical protein
VRVFCVALLAAALAACAPQQPARCDISVTSDVNFTAPEARDTVTARVLGPSCDKTIGLYTIHAQDGYPIWSWTAPMAHRFGDLFDHTDAAHMREFLQRWSRPTTLATTNTAPPFARLAPGQTTLDRLTYEDIRARNLPMLCHLSGTARETCVFWEPAAGGAGHFLDREVEGSAT